MMTNQPKWKCIANLGDVDPIEHGGIFVLVDETGRYDPELEILEVPEDEVTSLFKHWKAYRIVMEPCTFEYGVLSDNPYHKDLAAWWVADLPSIARTTDTSEQDLITGFCSPDPIERAIAWQALWYYYGPTEFCFFGDSGGAVDGLHYTETNKGRVHLRYQNWLKQLEKEKT